MDRGRGWHLACLNVPGMAILKTPVEPEEHAVAAVTTAAAGLVRRPRIPTDADVNGVGQQDRNGGAPGALDDRVLEADEVAAFPINLLSEPALLTYADRIARGWRR